MWRWTDESQLLTQFQWPDGTLFLNLTTAQLRRLQQVNEVRNHPAIRKWEATLQCTLPDYIWAETWVQGRAAKENTFLWLIVFRAFATLSWRFPSRPSTDPTVWCPRCRQGLKEDHLHCIWQCAASTITWKWCNAILSAVACNSTPMQIQPQHVILAVAFPLARDIPSKLWRIVRAVICWQNWLAHNECVFNGIVVSPERIIRTVWHRLGTYIRLEWKQLLARVRNSEISLSDAQDRMCCHFGREGIVWELDVITVKFPPCPPRPP